MGFVVLTIFLIFTFRYLRTNPFCIDLSSRWLWIGWFIKIGCSVAYVIVFAYWFGDQGDFYGDSYNFLRDSKVLSDLAFENFAEFSKIFFGLSADDPEITARYLTETRIWDYGDNGDFINDNRMMIRIHAVIHFISFGNIWLHSLIMAFLAYLGILMFYTAMSRFIANKTLFFLVLCAFPSIAFWGSGLTKEALMILGMGGTFYFAFKILWPPKEKTVKRFTNLLFFLLSVCIFLFNKPYVGLVVIPLLGLFVIAKKLNWNPRLIWVWLVLIVSGGIILSNLSGSLNLVDKVSYKQRDLINIGKGGIFFITDSSFCAFDYAHQENFNFFEGDTARIQVNKATEGEYKLFGDYAFHPFTIPSDDKKYELYLTLPPSNTYVEVTPVNYSGLQLVKNIPEAFLNTLLRPFPTDAGETWINSILFLLNLTLIGFGIFVVNKWQKLEKSQQHLFFVLMSAALLIFLIIGWTTPILGAVVRYKMGAELLLLTALFVGLRRLNIFEK